MRNFKNKPSKQNNCKKILIFLIILCLNVSCNYQNKLSEKNFSGGGDYYEQLNLFGCYIWHKERNLTFYKKNLNFIYTNLKTSEDINFKYLKSYNLHLTSDKKLIANNLNFSERTYISAYIVNFLYKCQEKLKINDPYKRVKIINHFLKPYKNYSNKYNREFKKHDYYGLKLLKKHHLKHYRYLEEDTIQKPPNRLSD